MARRSSSATTCEDPAVAVGRSQTAPPVGRRNYVDFDDNGIHGKDSEAAVERWLTFPATNSNNGNKKSRSHGEPDEDADASLAAIAAFTARMRVTSTSTKMTRGQRLLRDRLGSAGGATGRTTSKSPSKMTSQQREQEQQHPKSAPKDNEYRSSISNGYRSIGGQDNEIRDNSIRNKTRPQTAFTFEDHEYSSSEYYHGFPQFHAEGLANTDSSDAKRNHNASLEDNAAQHDSSNLRRGLLLETLKEDSTLFEQPNYRMPSPGMVAPPPPPPPGRGAPATPSSSSPRRIRSTLPNVDIIKHHNTVDADDDRGRRQSSSISSPTRQRRTLSSPNVVQNELTRNLPAFSPPKGGDGTPPSVATSCRTQPDSINNNRSENASAVTNSTNNAIKDAILRGRSNASSSRNRMKALYQQQQKKKSMTSPVSPSRTTVDDRGLAYITSPENSGCSGDSEIDDETEYSSKHSSKQLQRQQQAMASSRTIQCVTSQAETEKVKNVVREFPTVATKRTTTKSPPRSSTISRHQLHNKGRAVSTGRIPRKSSSIDISDEEREKAEKNTRGLSMGRSTRTSEPRQQALTVTTPTRRSALGFIRPNSNHGSPLSPMALLRKTNRVKLHVYDLVAHDTQLDLWGCHFPLGQCFNAVNSSLHSMGTGAYHVGIEINGVEYAYGANSTKGLTGVFTCMPKHSPGYQFRTTIDFGDRFTNKKSAISTTEHSNALVPCDGREVVRAMASDYMGTDYDLFRKNCCTFAHDACIRLGVKEEEIPNWFHNLAAAGAVTQDAANSTLGPLTHVFTACELNKFAQYINDTAFDDGFEVINACPEGGRSEQIIDRTLRKSTGVSAHRAKGERML